MFRTVKFQIPQIFVERPELSIELICNASSSSGNAFCSVANTIAYYFGPCLVINTDSKNKDAAIKYEMEFEHDLEALCWDPEGRCLIVADSQNNLHFVDNCGNLVFSYRILPGNISILSII